MYVIYMISDDRYMIFLEIILYFFINVKFKPYSFHHPQMSVPICKLASVVTVTDKVC